MASNNLPVVTVDQFCKIVRLQFEEGIEKTVRWYLDNQEWMDNILSGDYEKYYEEMYKGR